MPDAPQPQRRRLTGQEWWEVIYRGVAPIAALVFFIWWGLSS